MKIKFSNFFSTSKHNKFKHNMDLMELVQKNSKIVLDAIGRIWINKIGKKDFGIDLGRFR